MKVKGRIRSNGTRPVDSRTLPRVVTGQVRRADGRPGAWALVRAFDRDLRRDTVLGEARTDAEGRYRIEYTAERFRRTDKKGADLVVAVIDGDRRLVSSPVRFGAQPSEAIDLLLPGEVQEVAPDLRKASEYERLLAAVKPALVDVPLHELTDAEVDVLAGQTGVERRRIAWLAESARLARADIRGEAGVAPREGGRGRRPAGRVSMRRADGAGLGAETYYAWLSAGLPADPDALAARGPKALIGTLRTAVAGGVVPARLLDELDAIGTKVGDLVTATRLRPAQEGEAASLGDLLDTLPGRLTPERREVVARVVAEPGGSSGDLAARLRDAGLDKRQAMIVARTLSLGDLAGGNAAVVRELQRIVARDADASLGSLAGLTLDRWLDLALAHGAPAGSAISAEEYASRLTHRVELLHPTATLAARLGEEAAAASPALADVARFLEQNPGYDAAATDVRAFAKRARFAGIEDRERVIRSLQGLHRARTLGASWDEGIALVEAGYTSALDVVHTPRPRLQADLGDRIAPERLEGIAARARSVHDSGVALMVRALPRFSPDTAAVLETRDHELPPALREAQPTLQELFKAEAACACRHCRSVLSPAAYFVDLLELLRRGGALEALLARRPDLAHLELSCENTEVEIPHIDLVLEILENALALPIDIELPRRTDAASALAADPLPESIMKALRRTTLDLAGGLKAARGGPKAGVADSTEWSVTDRHRRWTLEHAERALLVSGDVGKGPRTMSLEGLDVEALIAGFDRGKVIPAARQRLESLLASSRGADRLLPVEDYSLDTIRAGSTWKLTYSLGARIRLDPDKRHLAIADLRGKEIDRRPYSSAALEQTKAALDDGVLGGVLGARARLDALERGRIREQYHVEPAGRAQPTEWTVRTQTRKLFLEYRGEHLTLASLAYQGSRRLEDLGASAENLNPEAYEMLRAACFPWSLPFDLPLAATRALLDRARVSRRRLMELADPAARLTGNAIALEVLGLSVEQAELIGKEAAGADLWKRWGLSLAPNGTATVYDASAGENVAGAPLEVLSRVSVLLQQARLSMEELLDLLETRFVAAAGAAPAIGPMNECRPSAMHLNGLKEGHLDRIHRFTRLRRALGWAVHELDIALAAVQPGVASADDLLLRLSHLVRLREMIGLPVEVLASWWGDLGGPTYTTHAADEERPIAPLYDRVFLNPLVQEPADPAFRLNAQRTEVAGAGAHSTISALAPLVAASLGIRGEELAALLGAASGVPDLLSLQNLGRLHRLVTLARGLNVAVAELLRFRSVTAMDPFASSAAAVEFCEVVGTIRASGASVEELLLVLRGETTPGSTLPLNDDGAARRLASVRARLRAKIAEWHGTYADLLHTLEDVAVAATAELFGFDVESASLLLRERLQHPGDAARHALDVLVDWKFLTGDKNAASPDPEAALSSELPRLSSGDLKKDPQWPPKPNEFPDAFALARRLHAVSLLADRFELGARELRWLADATGAPKALAAIELDDLPVASVTGPTTLSERWLRLAALAQVRSRAAGMDAMLAGYVARLETDDLPGARSVIASALSISASEVNSGAGEVGMVAAEDYRNPLLVLRLVELLSTIKRLGATLAQIGALTSPAPDFPSAKLARELARARYGADRWPEVVKPVSDALRLRQRDALVDCLIARDGLRDAEALYERYLIDVQVAPCARTSRLVAAIAAVQLFVQRVLFNAEAEAQPSAIDRDLWEWMKSYRVWEANRKVFLYPENWLAPELRDDKTEAFRELEGSLAGNEASDERAREALVAYLDDFGELAGITVLGMYEDADAKEEPPRGTRTLYLVGRSPNSPYRYFWRRCEDFGGTGMQWSGWEQVDLDISGDHVLPFVLQGDLHIAWPIITRTKDQNDVERWEVKLAWARRTSRGWSQKKISGEEALRNIPALKGRDERESFAFRLAPTRSPLPFHVPAFAEEMKIHCYAAGVLPTSPTLQPQGDAYRDGSAPTLFINVKVYVKYGGAYAFGTGASVTVTVKWSRPNNKGVPIPATGAHLKTTDNSGTAEFDLPLGKPGEIGELLDVSVQVRHPACPSTFENRNPRMKRLEKGQGDSWPKEWRPEFVFDAGDGYVEDRPAGTLSLALVGDFLIKPLEDVVAIQHGAPGPVLDLPPGAQSWGSAFREEAKGEHAFTLPASGGETIFGWTPGRYVSLPAGSSVASAAADGAHQPPWHYSDAGGSYLMRRQPSGDKYNWAFFADSNRFAGVFRSLAAPGPESLYGSPAVQAASDRSVGLAAHEPAVEIAADALTAEEVSFDLRSPNATYHWEIFFHAPLLVAEHLAREQRFADAERWLRFVFDPTSNDSKKGPSRFWRFFPFRRAAAGESIRQLMEWLADPDSKSPERTEFQSSVEAWKRHPFQPYAVARLRPDAYRWRAVFTYLDVLIAWGDQLFRQGTRESVSEATQLYILAARILGPRPQRVRSMSQPPVATYRDLVGRWDDFTNAWYAFSDAPVRQGWLRHLPDPARELLEEHGVPGRKPGVDSGDTLLLSSLGTLHFCVPPNERVEEYRARVSERLFNIRHCRDIEGLSVETPLFEPSIDPELLVRATAAGVDIATVLADREAPPSAYRFSVLVGQAQRLCAELKSLGAGLLQALEKRDAEEMAQLRSTQELAMLALVREVRERQLEEARARLAALRASEVPIIERFAQYQRLLGRPSVQRGADGAPQMDQTSALQIASGAAGEVAGLGLIPHEIEQLGWLDWALGYTWASSISNSLASVFHAASLPNYGHAAGALASFAGALASNASHSANRAAMLAGYHRRRDEWVHASRLALGEFQALRRQMAATEVSVAIAECELVNHRKQTENAKAMDELLRDKYTNRALYSWLATQLSTVYFRTYQLAYDTAKRAERAYRYELGLTDSDLIPFGSWESLRGGLMAGERLAQDLQRMELSFLDRNRRDYEITKHVSLVLLDPLALITLKETGECSIRIPEALFDLDYPGHYMRRIRSVALSIPCVTGPYTSVNCTLALLSSHVRISKSHEDYAEGAKDPIRFISTFEPITKTIVTSHGQGDRGLFEPSFRDERYLPFEGAGVISEWKLSLPPACNTFDLRSISDVVLRIDYTARDGGDDLRKAALEAAVLPAPEDQKPLSQDVAVPAQSNLRRMFSARHEFASEWYRFMHPAPEATAQTLELPLGPERFPYQYRGHVLSITRMDFYLLLRGGVVVVNNRQKSFLEIFNGKEVEVRVTPPGGAAVLSSDGNNANQNILSDEDLLDGTPSGVVVVKGAVTAAPPWQITVDGATLKAADLPAQLRDRVKVNGATIDRLKEEAIEDLVIVCHYQA